MDDFWSLTEWMYSSLFEKPRMCQKLLEKPPFKYIYDIVTETTRVTGYALGLYNDEELDSNYFNNKDRKVAYLTKIIDLTQLILNEEILANPLKIVSGLEPQLTNLMLQAIYRAATSGINSDALVQKVLFERDQYHVIQLPNEPKLILYLKNY